MEKITLEINVNVPVDLAWEFWTKPGHIVGWNFALDEWCCPYAENDLQKGGKFSYRMEARDGSMGFDFGGTYEDVTLGSRIAYVLGDARRVTVEFLESDGGTKIIEVFDPENINPAEMQRQGWQAILDNFKKYAETQLP